MKFTFCADTDKGISKNSNQDSLVVKHATYDGGEILMAVICDGMGGLAKGELASATVVREFDKWFKEELPVELEDLDLEVITSKWEQLLKDLNVKIQDYSKGLSENVGTTATCVLMINDSYIVSHVGDTRLYHLDSSMTQMTTDHTFIAREISRGTLTVEQAKSDKRRNLLLQCIGASTSVKPESLSGTLNKGAYLLCTDGFRHVISETEIFDMLNPSKLKNKKTMQKNIRSLIDLVKDRNEKDNISAILIKVD